MRQQKATDACIDALKRKRPDAKPRPIVGTLSKPPPEFPVFAGLDFAGRDEVPQADAAPGSTPPKVCPSKLLVVEFVAHEVVACAPRLLCSPAVRVSIGAAGSCQAPAPVIGTAGDGSPGGV